MKNFIRAGEYELNPDKIDFIRYLPDGSVTVHIGSNAITFDKADSFGFLPLDPPVTEMPPPVLHPLATTIAPAAVASASTEWPVVGEPVPAAKAE